MDVRTFDLGYSRMRSYYQTKDNQSKYDLWWDKLAPISADAFNRAVDLWIENERFFPTLGQIRQLAYKCQPGHSDGQTNSEDKFTEQEIALGSDLFPLFQRYANGQTTKEEWEKQMIYFADKHNLGAEMRNSIRRTAE